MFEGVFTPANLVYLAGAFYVAGLAITNQIVLRLFLLGGTGIYLIYYSTIAEHPLWEAIYVSLLIGLANLGGLTSLITRNSRWAIPAAHADIYFDFPSLSPGDFRALMKLAKRSTVTNDRLDLSGFDAAPLIAFTATKESYYGTETDGRIPARCGAYCADQWADAQTGG